MTVKTVKVKGGSHLTATNKRHIRAIAELDRETWWKVNRIEYRLSADGSAVEVREGKPVAMADGTCRRPVYRTEIEMR